LIWTRPLYDKLQQAGVDVELHTVAGAGHLQAVVDRDAMRAAFDFLDKHLLLEKHLAKPNSSH